MYVIALCVLALHVVAGTDPDENRNAIQLITSKGYEAEDHIVQTDDGYIIHVHRIPCRRSEAGTAACRNSRTVVFLQHGLEGDSTNWLFNLANESLAFILADAGYDVWMGNMRGNDYAKNHTTLSPDQAAFWQFSFDEMAAHDIPCMVNYVLKTTGKENLYYAGHSQGTMVGFIQFSQDQEFAKKIKHFYALAPVASVHHIKGPLKLIAPLTKIMDNFLKTFGVNDFTVPPAVSKALADIVCKGYIGNPLCNSVMFLFCGPDSKQLNTVFCFDQCADCKRRFIS